MLRFFPAIALLACGNSTAEVELPQTDVVMGPNWVQLVAETPSAFSALMEDNRNHWIALHRSDYKAVLAETGASEALQFRAHASLANFYFRLARLDREAWAQTQKTWSATNGLEIATELEEFPQVATLNGHRNPWPWPDPARNVPEYLDLAVDLAMAEAAMETLSLSIPDLLARSTTPAFQSKDGKVNVYDPLVYQALFLRHQTATKTPDTTDLGHVLFSPCGAELADSTGDNVAAHPLACFDEDLIKGHPELDLKLGETDDAQVARELARALDIQWSAWLQGLQSRVADDGKALLQDLSLGRIYRNQNLISLAEQCLDRDRPRQALALAQMAQDMAHPREIGPLNPPILFAILAEANVMTGHTREALDYLEVLIEAYPEVLALDETVGDLAVLKGMSRQGDSKEL
jgi:tetratricopeptide (TPR) repeat protein